MKNSTDICISTEDSWFRYRTAAIIIEDGKMLFVTSKNTNYYYTVGGAVNLGEKAETCVEREVFEETGVHFEVDRLCAICENFFIGKEGSVLGKKCQTLELYFLMKPRSLHCSSEQKTQLESLSINQLGDTEELVWIPLEELSVNDIKPEFIKTRLEEILKSDRILHILNGDPDFASKRTC